MATETLQEEDLKAEDPDSLNRNRRIAAIHDAREAVKEKSNDAYEALASDQIDRTLANTIIRQAVEHYIIELEALIKSEDEYKSRYWEQKDLGEVGVGTSTHQFKGLESIVEAPEFLEDSWEQTVVDDVRGKEQETVRVQQQIPMDVLMNAYRTANAFCAEIGLDIKLEDAKLPRDKL